MTKTVEACFWIIGAKNTSQPPAVAVDLHNEDGEVVGETYTDELADVNDAHRVAIIHAAENGIGPDRVHYDEASTQAFANC